MRYEGNVYRPPSEANSYILQLTIGCSHNACTFCGMYKDKKFRVRPLQEILEDISMARIRYRRIEKVFLADGDALTLNTDTLVAIIDELKLSFPELVNIGIYAGPKSILEKHPDELIRLQKHGLSIAYLGVETGDPDLLSEIHKGCTVEEMVAAGQAIIQSGIKLSVTILLGLAGDDQAKSEKHAINTGQICSQINPDYLSALTLMLVPQTVLYRKQQQGRFTLPGAYDIIQELKTIIEHLEMQRPCIFRSNHASNYVPIKGTLPQDKEQILSLLDNILNARDNRYLRPEYLRGL